MTPLSHLITRMSSVSLTYIIRESLDQQSSNAHLNNTKTRTPTLEHRYKNFVNPRKDYDWRNDISEYPTIKVDESLIHRGFAEQEKVEEAEREEPCETKLSRCLSGAEMRQASRRLVKCEAHLSLREAQDVRGVLALSLFFFTYSEYS